MIIFQILWTSSKIFFLFIPVFAVFLLSWITSIPKKPINALNPIWHLCLIIQHLIYLEQSNSYSIYKHILLFMFILERLTYMTIYFKYSNIHEQIRYIERYSSLITNVIPYSILNFLIAIPFYLFYSEQTPVDKQNIYLFFTGFMIYGFAVLIAVYKFWQVLIERPSATSLNAALFSDVLSMIGIFLINCSMGSLVTILCSFLNYISIRISLGRPLFDKEKDFIPSGFNVIPKVLIK